MGNSQGLPTVQPHADNSQICISCPHLRSKTSIQLPAGHVHLNLFIHRYLLNTYCAKYSMLDSGESQQRVESPYPHGASDGERSQSNKIKTIKICNIHMVIGPMPSLSWSTTELTAHWRACPRRPLRVTKATDLEALLTLPFSSHLLNLWVRSTVPEMTERVGSAQNGLSPTSFGDSQCDCGRELPQWHQRLVKAQSPKPREPLGFQRLRRGGRSSSFLSGEGCEDGHHPVEKPGGAEMGKESLW